jgi:membrane protein DedA with SNARE-associated domain
MALHPGDYALLANPAILAWTNSYYRGGAMGASSLSRWQKIKQHRVAIGIVAIVLAVIGALIIIGYQFDWTGFGG